MTVKPTAKIPITKTKPEQVIQERESTHGDFSVNTEIMQQLKESCRSGPKFRSMSAFQKESIEMICHKLGRIVCGDPDFQDHWVDIAGYAQLVSQRLPQES